MLTRRRYKCILKRFFDRNFGTCTWAFLAISVWFERLQRNRVLTFVASSSEHRHSFLNSVLHSRTFSISQKISRVCFDTSVEIFCNEKWAAIEFSHLRDLIVVWRNRDDLKITLRKSETLSSETLFYLLACQNDSLSKLHGTLSISFIFHWSSTDTLRTTWNPLYISLMVAFIFWSRD